MIWIVKVFKLINERFNNTFSLVGVKDFSIHFLLSVDNFIKLQYNKKIFIIWY